jgi:hypothetical protein
MELTNTASASGDFMIQSDTESQSGNSNLLLTRQRIPLVKMPSFTDDGDGHFQLATDIDYAWPQCYGFFPAGTLAIGQPDGFYYCEMSATDYGRVSQDTYIPAAGVNPEVPASPNWYSAALVGGAGFVGDILYYVSSIPAGLLTQGKASLDGLLRSTIDCGLTIELDGTTLLNLTAINSTLTSSGTELYAINDSLQQFAILSIPYWVQSTVDMTVDQELSYTVTSTNVDSYATLTNFGVTVDNR